MQQVGAARGIGPRNETTNAITGISRLKNARVYAIQY